MKEEIDKKSYCELMERIYQQKNYECIDTGIHSDICYIFFSSNGLYYPNTAEVFEEQIVKKNRYEWKWVVKNSNIPQTAGKIIYVRDIYKIWYSKGISNKCNTIEKTIDLLKQLTEGYKVVTVGSSAGGYMAVLTAIKLNAQYCLNFSGQYHIAVDSDNLYCNLVELLPDYKGKIFYFVPAYCESDQKEYQSVKEMECVKSFLFHDKKHASTMITGNMSYIIDRSEANLMKLYQKWRNKYINKFLFLFQTVPLGKVFAIVQKEIEGFIIRKKGIHWNGI